MTLPPMDEAAFIGRLTAGTTHEIRNVLSVIRESAGLMEDLLDMEGAGSFPHGEKFRKMLANIRAQVERGSKLAKSLSTLAHAPDDRMRTVDVGEVAETQSVLCARFCRMKGVGLCIDRSGSGTFMVTDPVRLHCAVWAVIEMLLAQAPSGSEISLSWEAAGDRVLMEFSLSSAGESSTKEGVGGNPDGLERALSLVSSLGGSLDVRFSEGHVRLDLPRGDGAPGQTETN